MLEENDVTKSYTKINDAFTSTTLAQLLVHSTPAQKISEA